MSLSATGYFIYLVKLRTPDAVVTKVVVSNAAFEHSLRYDAYSLTGRLKWVRFLVCTRQRRVTFLEAYYLSKVHCFLLH